MKFTIGRKIGLGFGFVVISTVIAFIYTNVIINDSKTKTDQVVKVVTPSVAALEDFQMLLQRSQILVTKWYHVQSGNDEPFKKELRYLIRYDYEDLKKGLDSMSVDWTNEERTQLKAIFNLTDILFIHYQNEIMNKLSGWSSYDDAQLLFTVRFPFEEVDEKLNVIYDQMTILISAQKTYANDVTDQMFISFGILQQVVKIIGIALVIGGILAALLTVNSIVKPVKRLKNILQSMSFGILPKERLDYRADEIGDMNVALNGLVEALESTTEFARQVGSGNFDSYYKPLSEQDTLGLALLKMRSDLRENERILEQKVIERTEQVVKQKEEIEQKNVQLEILYKQVTDSIRYAKRIQEAILPPDSVMKELLPNSFVLYKPKDIVSGDFYYVGKHQEKVWMAAVDCTGHGVPGAFMSLVGHNLLKNILADSKKISPGEVLDLMSIGVNKALHNEKVDDASQTKDGMDMSLISIDLKKMEMQFAGAFNPLYFIRDGALAEYKADKYPVGLRTGHDDKHFSTHTIPLKKGDVIYIFSDGYADQFGGPKGKKFMIGKFRELLVQLSKENIANQQKILDRTIEEWRGGHDQVDDILVMGVKI